MIIRRNSIKTITESLAHLQEINVGPEVVRIQDRDNHKRVLKMVMADWQVAHDGLGTIMQLRTKMHQERPRSQEAYALDKKYDMAHQILSRLTNAAHTVAGTLAKAHGGSGEHNELDLRALAASHMTKHYSRSPHHFVNQVSNFMQRTAQPIGKRINKDGHLEVDMRGPDSHKIIGHIKSVLNHHGVGGVADHKIDTRGREVVHKLKLHAKIH